MDGVTIVAESVGDINVDVHGSTPNVSLLPSENPIVVSPSVSESPSICVTDTDNEINVNRTTRDLYILDEEDLGKIQSIERHEVTEEEMNAILDEIDGE